MGPLENVKIVEVGGIGPGPFCAQMLSDMGAHIVRVDRKDKTRRGLEAKYAVLYRGRPSMALDIAKPEGLTVLLKIVDQCDALIEGFRPGIMEKLGIGPEVCLNRNPKLVYGRMTGWGQYGPLARTAGHDINYISLSGALHAIGRPGERPVPPLNLIGDFGGGGMLLAFGILCALLEAQKSGLGQVVDAAMVDGSAALMGSIYGRWAAGLWTDQRGTNLLDGGAPFYDTYETADGKWISIGSIEPKFYALLLQYAEIGDPDFQPQFDQTRWPDRKKKLTEIFRKKSREEWCAILENTDVCFAPVLCFDEAIIHPHNVARKTFVDVGGVIQPAPAPRFSRTQPETPSPAPEPGANTESELTRWGFASDEIQALKEAGAI